MWVLAGLGALEIGVWSYVLWRGFRLPPARPSRFLKRPRPPGPVVVCLGDSLTHGHVGYDWVGGLAAELPEWSFVNAGVNGEVAWSALQRVPRVIACDPDWITVLLGSNDAIGAHDPWGGRGYRIGQRLPRTPEPAWFREVLDEILTTLGRETQANIAVMTLQPMGEVPGTRIAELVEEHNQIISAVAAEHDVTLLPLHDRLSRLLEAKPPRPRMTFRGAGLGLVFRVAWSCFLHYALRQSWGRIAARRGLTLTFDTLHFTEDSGPVLQGLVQDWLTTPTST